MFLDVCKDIDFIDCAFFQFLIFFEPAYFNHFDRIFLIIIFVDGTVYFTVGTLPDNLIESVVFDYAHHC